MAMEDMWLRSSTRVMLLLTPMQLQLTSPPLTMHQHLTTLRLPTMPNLINTGFRIFV